MPPTNFPSAIPSFIVIYSSSSCPRLKSPFTNLFITSLYAYSVCHDVNALNVAPLNVITPVLAYIAFVSDVLSLNPQIGFGLFFITS